MLLITITHIMLLIINHYYLSYILKLNDFVCLFVCSELIGELIRAIHLKLGMCL